MKILVVDDIGVVRYYLEQALKQHGHQVVTAATAHQALEILAQDNTVKVVLTDLMMPGMDGLELFKAARKIDRFNDAGPLPPLDFILMTALRPNASTPRKERNLLQQATDLGFIDVLMKPVDIDHLTRMLAQLDGGTAGVVGPAFGPALLDDIVRAVKKLEERMQGTFAERDRPGLTKIQDRLPTLEQRLSTLRETVSERLQSLDAARKPAAGRAPVIQSIETTLKSLETAADRLGDADQETAEALCKELEAKASQLRERMRNIPAPVVS